MDTNHRTAPRWISEAIEACESAAPGVLHVDRLAAALLERLPLEAMGRCNSLPALVRVLTDGDPEVVQLAELYQDACRALDDAGVPYASDVDATGEESASAPGITLREVRAPRSQTLDLAGRIRWLAQQRPTRLELQRLESERDAARSHLVAIDLVLKAAGIPLETRRDEGDLTTAVQALATERDQLRTMYENASDDLDRERTAHQEGVAAASNREIALTVVLENARQERDTAKEALQLFTERVARAVRMPICNNADHVVETIGGLIAAVTERNAHLRSLVESDMPAGDMRCALAELIGVGDRMMAVAATDRHVLRAKVADQAAYIEQLELEIEALEDEIWEDEP